MSDDTDRLVQQATAHTPYEGHKRIPYADLRAVCEAGIKYGRENLIATFVDTMPSNVAKREARRELAWKAMERLRKKGQTLDQFKDWLREIAEGGQ